MDALGSMVISDSRLVQIPSFIAIRSVVYDRLLSSTIEKKEIWGKLNTVSFLDSLLSRESMSKPFILEEMSW